MVNSRDKGKRGELEARDEVRRLWSCPECVRTGQVSGKFSSDLMNGPDGLHLEVKRYASIAATKFMDQAARDASQGNVPVVLMKENGGDWLLMLRLNDSVGFSSILKDHLDAQKS